MTRLIITVAALAFAGAASAVEMPKEFRGRWCDANVTDQTRYSRNPKPDNCETYDSGMTVTASGYTGHHAECSLRKVSRRRGHYRMQFDCESPSLNDVLVPLDKRQVWQFEGGDLVIR